MSFISAHVKNYHVVDDQQFYIITDSDLGEITVAIPYYPTQNWSKVWIGIVKVYIERNLPVGRNLALATIYWGKLYGASVKQLTKWQDKDCPKHIDRWGRYAKERDEHLEKLLPLL